MYSNNFTFSIKKIAGQRTTLFGEFISKICTGVRVPRLVCQTKSRYAQSEMNAQGGVVRSKLHGLETPMNAGKSGHRYV